MMPLTGVEHWSPNCSHLLVFGESDRRILETGLLTLAISFGGSVSLGSGSSGGGGATRCCCCDGDDATTSILTFFSFSLFSLSEDEAEEEELLSDCLRCLHSVFLTAAEDGWTMSDCKRLSLKARLFWWGLLRGGADLGVALIGDSRRLT